MPLTHVRSHLRSQVMRLLAGLPTTADRVYRGRRRNLPAGHEPCLLVYTEDEDTALDSMAAAALQDRQVMLMVEGRANGTDEADLEDLLDAMAVEVEGAVLGGAPVLVTPAFGFGGDGFILGSPDDNFVLGVPAGTDELAVTTVLVRTRVRQMGDRAEMLNGGIRLEFRVTYNTAEGEPTAAV